MKYTIAAKLAHKAKAIIGHPYDIYFKYMVRENMIKNLPITTSDATNSHTTFSPNLSGTRGKKVQHNLDRVVMDYVTVPR